MSSLATSRASETAREPSGEASLRVTSAAFSVLPTGDSLGTIEIVLNDTLLVSGIALRATGGLIAIQFPALASVWPVDERARAELEQRILAALSREDSA